MKRPEFIALLGGVTVAWAYDLRAQASEAFTTLVARHRIPTVYPLPDFARSGGLLYCGVDLVEQCRRAADYIDRILRAPSRPIFRCSRPRNSSWSSTSRPRRRSGSRSRLRSSLAPTRQSSRPCG